MIIMKPIYLGIIFNILIFLISLGMPSPSTAKRLKIAMLLWRGETKAEEGFKDGLKNFGYSAEYTILDAGQDRKYLRRILSKEIEPKLTEFDYIYTFGTTVSKMTKIFLQNRVPQLFNVVTSPVESGIVESMEKTGSNLCGVNDVIPISVQIESALKLFQFKRLGFLFNPREKNSMIQREKLYDIAEGLRFEVVDIRSPPALDMLQKNLQKLIDRSIVVDAVYLPSDSYLISNARLIGSRLRTAKIKSIGSIKTFIENGAFLGVVFDYYQMGQMVAAILDRHQKGEQLFDIPVQQIYDATEPTLMINRTTSEVLNFKFPEELLRKAVLVY